MKRQHAARHKGEERDVTVLNVVSSRQLYTNEEAVSGKHDVRSSASLNVSAAKAPNIDEKGLMHVSYIYIVYSRYIHTLVSPLFVSFIANVDGLSLSFSLVLSVLSTLLDSTSFVLSLSLTHTLRVCVCLSLFQEPVENLGALRTSALWSLLSLYIYILKLPFVVRQDALRCPPRDLALLFVIAFLSGV